jgi:stress-induced morphogen
MNLPNLLSKLEQNFNPEDKIMLKDERGDGSHLSLEITSDIFEGKSRIDRSRFVHQILDDDFGTGKIHALKLKLKTHSE